MRLFLALGLFAALCGLAQPWELEAEMLYKEFPENFNWGVATAAYQVNI